MNKLFPQILIAIFLAFPSTSSAQNFISYEVITEKSDLKWVARKVGGRHEGITPIKSGTFRTIGNQIITGDFVVDMTGLELTDTESRKLAKHLKSKDFFNVEDFPEASLKVISSQVIDEETFQVRGKMTIRGVEQAINFEVKVLGQTENFISYGAKIVINRTKFGITYRSSLGDAFIMDDFDVSLKITAKKSS